jgi:hypothetical protein
MLKSIGVSRRYAKRTAQAIEQSTIARAQHAAMAIRPRMPISWDWSIGEAYHIRR